MDDDDIQIIEDDKNEVIEQEEKPIKEEEPDDNCNESLDEGTTCSICFDDYTNSGSHRLVCLACGHLFGESCIRKWIGGKSGNRKCPKCKTKANLKDIRKLYARGLKMIDTSEKEWAMQQLEKEKCRNRELELMLAAERMKAQKCANEASRPKRSRLRSPNPGTSGAAAAGYDPHVFSSENSQLMSPEPPEMEAFAEIGVALATREGVPICDSGSSRAMDFSSYMGIAVATCKSNNNLWNGFGIRKVNLALRRATDYLHVHLNRPRDVKFSPVNDGLLLSTGEDKWLRISSVHTNNTINGFQLPAPGWCCAWRQDAPHYVFAGLMNGRVLLFDTRMISERREIDTNGQEPVCEVTGGVNGIPVSQLQWIEAPSQANHSSSALLVTKLNQSYLFECGAANNSFKPHLLPLEGQITSLSYDLSSNHFMASFRPSRHHNTVTHEVHQLTCNNVSTDPARVDMVYSSQSVHSFSGGSAQQHMTRNCLSKHPFAQDRCLAAVFNEQQSQLHLFDTATANEKAVSRVQVKGAMQVLNMSVANKSLLAVLGQEKMQILEVLRT